MHTDQVEKAENFRSSPILSHSPEGLVLIDKPETWTSHDVVAKLRILLRVKKIGHAGTLDPMATGLLIVLVGKNYTKMQPAFLTLPKTYTGTFELGWETDTYDRTGIKVKTAQESNVAQITPHQIAQSMSAWLGTHQQTVPAFSAVKFHGRSLHRLARAAEQLPELPSKEVTFYQIELNKVAVHPQTQVPQVTFTIICSSGTYIRSWVHDLGQDLKVGAVLTSLRRTAIGDYAIENAVAPNEVSEKNLINLPI